jgi:hypothetical protein
MLSRLESTLADDLVAVDSKKLKIAPRICKMRCAALGRRKWAVAIGLKSKNASRDAGATRARCKVTQKV